MYGTGWDRAVISSRDYPCHCTWVHTPRIQTENELVAREIKRGREEKRGEEVEIGKKRRGNRWRQKKSEKGRTIGCNEERRVGMHATCAQACCNLHRV